ncbi:MAG: hypothetical protein J7J01_01050 [Methanophagales archaeon]|nr:hypothetical protein [Methanophagales archaeon]
MSSYDIDYIKDLCRHERVTPPPCLEYLCENKPEKAVLFLKRAGMLRKGLKNVARALNLDLQRCGGDDDEKWIINTQLDLEAALCREVPEEFCDPTCRFYPSRRVFEVLENAEIKAYKEEDDVFFDVWLNGEHLTIRLSQFQRGLQTLLWMANEPVYFLTLPRKTTKEIINAALKYFHKKAKRLSSVEAYERGISLEGEELLDYVLDFLFNRFFEDDVVYEETDEKPFIKGDKIYIPQEILIDHLGSTSKKKLTRALTRYGIKVKRIQRNLNRFRAYEIPVKLFEDLKMPIEKIREHAHRIKEERESELHVDATGSVDELIEQLRSDLGGRSSSGEQGDGE